MNNLRLLAVWLLLAATAGMRLGAQSPRTITLDEIFKSAEVNSTQLRPFTAAEREAESEIASARTTMLPDINAHLNIGYIGNGFITKRNFTDYQIAKIPHLSTGAGININQPVYTGGAITSAIELAEIKSTAARFATDTQRQNLRFQLTGYYLDIYKCHNLLSVVDANIVAAEKVVADMHARYEQGTALLNDITRYELLLSNLQLQRTKLNNTLAILNNNLVTMAGLPESTTIIPDSTILAQALPRQGENYWQEEASTNSPVLKSAQTAIKITEKAERITKAERMPKVGIQAGWTMDGPITVEVPPINRNLSYWWVGVGLSYNISSLYKTNKAIARSHAAVVTATDRYNATRQDIEVALHADYIKYLEAYEQLKTNEKSVELAERNYAVTSTRYGADMALITDMLDAANSRLDAQQQLVNSRIDVIYYYYKLLFNSGKI